MIYNSVAISTQISLGLVCNYCYLRSRDAGRRNDRTIVLSFAFCKFQCEIFPHSNWSVMENLIKLLQKLSQIDTSVAVILPRAKHVPPNSYRMLEESSLRKKKSRRIGSWPKRDHLIIPLSPRPCRNAIKSGHLESDYPRTMKSGPQTHSPRPNLDWGQKRWWSICLSLK